ncbi:MAG: ABC transporter substrate-binding protein, partial [Actinomycetota bacterium]
MKRMLVAGLCALLIGVGCGAGSADDAVNDSGRDSITLGFTLEPTSLDISGTAGQSIPQVLLDNVYEGLVRVDENGAIVAALAEQYSVSDDGLSYTFTLRDARFHDGSVLSAEDVVWSLNRVLDDATTAVLPTQVA